MNIVIKEFSELTLDELYAVLKLRVEVFIMEQNCLYQDLDGNDHLAYHVMVMEDDKLAAYARVFRSGIRYTASSIGRVITSPEFRRKGYGDILMKEAVSFLQALNERHIMLSSQSYAQGFYEKHGFKRTARDSYLEDDIPHVEMEYVRGEEHARKKL